MGDQRRRGRLEVVALLDVKRRGLTDLMCVKEKGRSPAVQSVCLGAAEREASARRAGLQDWDKFRGESRGSALTSLPLFVSAAIFKAWNVVPARGEGIQNKFINLRVGERRGGRGRWTRVICCCVFEWISLNMCFSVSGAFMKHFPSQCQLTQSNVVSLQLCVLCVLCVSQGLWENERTRAPRPHHILWQACPCVCVSGWVLLDTDMNTDPYKEACVYMYMYVYLCMYMCTRRLDDARYTYLLNLFPSN